MKLFINYTEFFYSKLKEFSGFFYRKGDDGSKIIMFLQYRRRVSLIQYIEDDVVSAGDWLGRARSLVRSLTR